MSRRLEELDWRQTPMGVSLRRRLDPSVGHDVYEVKLGEEFLMSSLFTVAEIALAELGLGALTGDGWDVVVGGLGLGYTAGAVLANDRVRSLSVVEALDAVIDWHAKGLLPLSPGLTSDRRCHLVHADFFAAVAGDGFGAPVPQPLHAVLVDIDHTPDHLLHPSHGGFYTPEGLARVRALLHPGGVFGLWSDAPPDARFVSVLDEVFRDVEAHVVSFPNPLTSGASTNTVYVARSPDLG